MTYSEVELIDLSSPGSENRVLCRAIGLQFVGWEKVNLPVGTFETMHFEKLIRLFQYDSFRMDTVRRDSIWIAPEIGRWIVREMNGEYRVSGGKGVSIRREDNFRWQLESWI